MLLKAVAPFAVGLFLTACATTSQEGSRATDRKYAEQMAALRKEADAGHATAAYRVYLLGQFYTYEPEIALRYLKLAADRGQVLAMIDLGALLLQSKDAADQKRGADLLEGAALVGNHDAKVFLEQHGKGRP